MFCFEEEHTSQFLSPFGRVSHASWSGTIIRYHRSKNSIIMIEAKVALARVTRARAAQAMLQD